MLGDPHSVVRNRLRNNSYDKKIYISSPLTCVFHVNFKKKKKNSHDTNGTKRKKFWTTKTVTWRRVQTDIPPSAVQRPGLKATLRRPSGTHGIEQLFGGDPKSAGHGRTNTVLCSEATNVEPGGWPARRETGEFTGKPESVCGGRLLFFWQSSVVLIKFFSSSKCNFGKNQQLTNGRGT